jgi:hypothetical protein
MEKQRRIYDFSILAVALSTLFIIIFLTGICAILIFVYYKSVFFGILLTAPFLLLMLDPLMRFSRVLYYAIIRKPALILLEDKLVDNVNDLVIYWAEIEHIGFLNKSTFGGQIAVKPKDLTMLLTRVKNPYKKIILRINQKYFKGAVSIPPNLLKCKRDELYHELVNTNFKKHINAVLYHHQ